MAFGSLITSLQSGRIDMTMAGMNDTKNVTADRLRRLLLLGITIMVQKGNPQGVTGETRCAARTSPWSRAPATRPSRPPRATGCVKEGKPAVNVTATDSDTQNQNQLRTGRVAAILNDLPSAAYLADCR